MWKLAFSQLRSHPRRYVAVLLAITLGTMFLAGALLVTSSAKATTKELLGTTYANADLLISGNEEVLYDPASAFYEKVGGLNTPGPLSQVDGVAEVYPQIQVAAGLQLPEGSTQQGTLDGRTDLLVAQNIPEDRSLLNITITSGSLPVTHTEVALDEQAAERHDLTVGDTVSLESLMYEEAYHFTVSGIIDTSADITSIGAMNGYMTASAMTSFEGDDPMYSTALVRVDGDLATVLEALQTELSDVATVNTPDVQISETLIDTLGFDAITVVLGGFAAIALLVMMLVINNTFSVLVAQRTRQYALQRVLGATRNQIRKAVLAETFLIGLIGSVLGMLAATGIIAGLIGLAQRWVSGATFAMDASVAWVLLAGVLITLVAGWVPAAKATRVSPLEAMRPIPAVTVDSKAGIFRLVFGVLAFVVGSGIMVYFAFTGSIGLAIAGGMLSFLGALLLGVLFVPGTVYGLGWLIRPTGVPGKMAQRNAVRNRSRTAATATALMIGTTLVAMILTGGQTVQNNFDHMLATNYPVDISAHLSEIDPADPAQAEHAAQLLADAEGVEAATVVTPVATIGDNYEEILAGDPHALANISAALTSQQAKALATPGTVLVSNRHTADTLTVDTPTGPVELSAVQSDLASVTGIVSTETAQTFGGEAIGTPAVWLKATTSDMTVTEMQDLITALATASGISVADFESPLIIRGMFEQIINTVMLTVIGLLGIAVLIALVGVANTLALSALERRRENSLMRALGLTKNGLRAMLSWEAILIALVGALLGSLLGMFYGWAGSVAIFAPIVGGDFGSFQVSWPWAAIAVILVTSVIAGLIASIAPAQRAARLSPVAGLAAE